MPKFRSHSDSSNRALMIRDEPFHNKECPVWIEATDGNGAMVFSRETAIEIAHELLKRAGASAPSTAAGISGRSAFG